MSGNQTVILSLPNNYQGKDALEWFEKYCTSKNIVIRCEPYDSDIYNELNIKALDIERAYALNELENEILNNVCVNGTCED